MKCIISNFLEQNNIKQIHISEGIANHKNTYFSNINFIDYEDDMENTLFWGVYRDLDIELIKNHEGKIWIYWHDNDCNPNYENRKQNVYNIIDYDIEGHLCNSKTTEQYLNYYGIIPTSLIYKINLNLQPKNILSNYKIVYLIVACNTLKYKDKYFKLLHFLENFKKDYIVVIGGAKETTYKNNILELDIKESWENLPKKVFESIKFIYTNTTYTHVYKVDDQFYLNNIDTTNKMLSYDYYGNILINDINRKYHFGKCSDEKLNKTEYTGEFFTKYASGEYGYIISRKCMFFILKNKRYMYKELYEDKAIGDILFKNNIFVNNHNKEVKPVKPIKRVKTVKTVKMRENTDKSKNKINTKFIKKNQTAVIFFHKNLKQLYKPRWIKKCIDSVLKQSFKEFDIFEVNYGNDNYSIFEDYNLQYSLKFYKKDFLTHTEAMNFLLNKCFKDYDYRLVFNTNLDDSYHEDRFELQKKCILKGYDLCSTLMNYIEEDDKNNDIDNITLEWTSMKLGLYSEELYINTLDIKKQLNIDHNVINHSSACFSNTFWKSFDCYDNLLRYRDDKPYEDLSLWQRAVNNDVKITIINNRLIDYRIHKNQIGTKNKDSDIDDTFKSNKSSSKKRIGIFCVCTGSYIQYFEQLVESVEKYFLIEYPHIFFISTDNIEYIENICIKYKLNFKIKYISKKGFPLDTLYRYKYIIEHENYVQLLSDVVYYLDVDMKIVHPVSDEILPTKEKQLIGTYHPGFYYSDNKRGPVNEVSELSTAYIPFEEQIEVYIAGGFNGGISSEFLDMAHYIHKNILIDKHIDIMARWHDESHLNYYLCKNFDKFKLLIPDYCYPENFYIELPGTPKILALSKDHDKVRKEQKKIITVNLLGGLGNILFQLAYAFSISQEFNINLVINLKTNEDKRKSSLNYHLLDNFFRNDIKDIDTFQQICEKQYSFVNYNTEIKDNENIYLSGYFQSTKYFKKYLNIFKKNLNFELLDIAKNIYEYIKNKYNNIIAIHIRGGDYLNLSHYHLNLDEKYYKKVDNIIFDSIENYKYILFTDDLKYTEEKFNRYYDFHINKLINEYLDDNNIFKNTVELEFLVLSLFETIICSNSTFSIWASYISNAKTIFIPSKWFSKDGPKDFNINDLCLNDKYKIIDIL